MSVTGSQIDLEDGETEKIITDDQGNRTYLVEVVGANAIRVSHNKRYAADGTTLSAGQTHTVSNLQGQQLFAAAYDGQTAIRVREASADVQSQPEKEVSVIDGSVDIAGDIDISDRSGREIGKARLEDSSGTLIDPVTGAEFQTNPRGVEASRRVATRTTRTSFRRTLVGLKRLPNPTPASSITSFRRTLVGLKRLGRHRRGPHRPVSDEPSWG